LAGLSNQMRQQLVERLMTPVKPFNYTELFQLTKNEEFSLSDVIISSIANNKGNSFQNSSQYSNELPCPFKDNCALQFNAKSSENMNEIETLAKYFESPILQNIIMDIIESCEIFTISKKIL
jgi:hypothetical protein